MITCDASDHQNKLNAGHRFNLVSIEVAFGKRCQQMGVMPSMGSVGDAYDNAMAESFFATVEKELLDRRRFKSQTEARTAIFEWIEGWYNLHRRHSSLGRISPINFERRQLVYKAAWSEG